MNYLLDTHVFIWSIMDSSRLSKKVLSILRKPTNKICISSVSIWEIVIKIKIKKLDLGGLPCKDLVNIGRELEYTFIDLTPDDALTYLSLREETHKDPFDRILIAQCIRNKFVMISKDGAFEKFKNEGLKLIW